MLCPCHDLSLLVCPRSRCCCVKPASMLAVGTRPGSPPGDNDNALDHVPFAGASAQHVNVLLFASFSTIAFHSHSVHFGPLTWFHTRRWHSLPRPPYPYTRFSPFRPVKGRQHSHATCAVTPSPLCRALTERSRCRSVVRGTHLCTSRPPTSQPAAVPVRQYITSRRAFSAYCCCRCRCRFCC
jgi:hypothetical protein